MALPVQVTGQQNTPQTRAAKDLQLLAADTHRLDQRVMLLASAKNKVEFNVRLLTWTRDKVAPESFNQAIESAKSVCDSAKEIVNRARQVAANAKKVEAEMVKKLESAEALARTCTTASQAADLREIYRNATYTVSALGSALKYESMQCTRLPAILDDFEGRWDQLMDLVETAGGDSILDDYQAGTTAINVSNEALRSGPDPLAEHTRLLAIATDLQRNSDNILTPQQKITLGLTLNLLSNMNARSAGEYDISAEQEKLNSLKTEIQAAPERIGSVVEALECEVPRPGAILARIGRAREDMETNLLLWSNVLAASAECETRAALRQALCDVAREAYGTSDAAGRAELLEDMRGAGCDMTGLPAAPARPPSTPASTLPPSVGDSRPAAGGSLPPSVANSHPAIAQPPSSGSQNTLPQPSTGGTSGASSFYGANQCAPAGTRWPKYLFFPALGPNEEHQAVTPTLQADHGSYAEYKWGGNRADRPLVNVRIEMSDSNVHLTYLKAGAEINFSGGCKIGDAGGGRMDVIFEGTYTIAGSSRQYPLTVSTMEWH
jgi:hypothetical protein